MRSAAAQVGDDEADSRAKLTRVPSTFATTRRGFFHGPAWSSAFDQGRPMSAHATTKGYG
jgi:hypothetical protein